MGSRRDTAESGFSIRGLQRRRRQSWRGMYDTLADGVYRYAYYRCRARVDVAEDVTQEVFQRALETIDGYRGDVAGLLPWLKGIALRVLSQRARAARRRAGRVVLSQAAAAGAGGVAVEAVDPAPAVDDGIISAGPRARPGLSPIHQRRRHPFRGAGRRRQDPPARPEPAFAFRTNVQSHLSRGEKQSGTARHIGSGRCTGH